MGRRIFVIVIVFVVAGMGLVAVQANATKPDKHVCYLFDPRLDDPLEDSVFDPPGWRDRWIPQESVESYSKLRRGFHLLEPGKECPEYVQYFPFSSRYPLVPTPPFEPTPVLIPPPGATVVP